MTCLPCVIFVVVDSENEENWDWFARKLRGCIEQNIAEVGWGGYTFFSDRNPALVKAIREMFPDSNHSICLRHLVDNFKVQVTKHNYCPSMRWDRVGNSGN